MDSLTHLALGACLGEALGRILGKSNAWALAQSIRILILYPLSGWIPLPVCWPTAFTHSFCFCAIITLFLPSSQNACTARIISGYGNGCYFWRSHFHTHLY